MPYPDMFPRTLFKLIVAAIAAAVLLLLANDCWAQTNFGAIPRSYPSYNSADPLGFAALRNTTADVVTVKSDITALRVADSNLTAVIIATSNALATGDLSVSNAFIAADDIVSARVTAISNLVAALPSTSYVDSKDALDRAYAYSLFQALTGTNSGGYISSTRLLDLADPSSAWLEYSGGVLYKVSVAQVPAHTNYQWVTYSTLDVEVTALGAFDAAVHPTPGVYSGAFTNNIVVGATGQWFIADAGFYPVQGATNGASVYGFATDGAYITYAFSQSNAYYSAVGDFASWGYPWIPTASALASYFSAVGPGAVGGPTTNGAMSFALGGGTVCSPGSAPYCYRVGPEVTAGEVRVFRTITSTSPLITVTNRVAFLSTSTNDTLRVYDSGGGAWKFLLPGEVQP